MEPTAKAEIKRPTIEDFSDPIVFVEAMLAYRKKAERGFSILRATKTLRRVSPALVSLVIARKRTLTADRADEFSKLLALTVAERHFFKAWIGGVNSPAPHDSLKAAIPVPLRDQNESASSKPKVNRKNRKDVSTHILKDWLNVYVKDLFQFEDVQKQPALAEKMLLHVASPKRVRASIDFLMREGHLRKTLDGRVVLDTPLSVADPKVPSQKIRAFHKAALGLAQKALERVPPTERMANTLIVPVNEKSYRELLDLIEDFGEKLKDFANNHPDDGTTLYQLIVNASPVGGKLK
jgi:uncharacterized protein (TIGR02147 family)